MKADVCTCVCVCLYLWTQSRQFGRGRVKLFCICSMHPCNPHRSCLLSSPSSPSFLPPLVWPRAQRRGGGGCGEEHFLFSLPLHRKKKEKLRCCVSQFLLPRCETLIFLLPPSRTTTWAHPASFGVCGELNGLPSHMAAQDHMQTQTTHTRTHHMLHPPLPTCLLTRVLVSAVFSSGSDDELNTNTIGSMNWIN